MQNASELSTQSDMKWHMIVYGLSGEEVQVVEAWLLMQNLMLVHGRLKWSKARK